MGNPVTIPPVEVLLSITLDQAQQILELRQDREILAQRNVEQERVIAELTGAKASPLEQGDALPLASPDGSEEPSPG